MNAYEGQLQYPLPGVDLYSSNEHCVWRIETNTTQVLNITFIRFNVENGNTCKYDYLSVTNICFFEKIRKINH